MANFPRSWSEVYNLTRIERGEYKKKYDGYKIELQ